MTVMNKALVKCDVRRTARRFIGKQILCWPRTYQQLSEALGIRKTNFQFDIYYQVEH